MSRHYSLHRLLQRSLRSSLFLAFFAAVSIASPSFVYGAVPETIARLRKSISDICIPGTTYEASLMREELKALIDEEAADKLLLASEQDVQTLVNYFDHGREIEKQSSLGRHQKIEKLFQLRSQARIYFKERARYIGQPTLEIFTGYVEKGHQLFVKTAAKSIREKAMAVFKKWAPIIGLILVAGYGVRHEFRALEVKQTRDDLMGVLKSFDKQAQENLPLAIKAVNSLDKSIAHVGEKADEIEVQVKKLLPAN